ncbi:unnamed protein product [Penicillium pancosmium]
MALESLVQSCEGSCNIVERWSLYSIYWAVNLVLALTDVDLTSLKYVAKRLGWISVTNFVLLVFLALKNTPLAPLSGHSYEKLRPLHKTAGYTCIFTTFLHASVYLSSYGISGDLENMRQTKNLAGAMAGLAMVILGFSTIAWLARNYYEYPAEFLIRKYDGYTGSLYEAAQNQPGKILRCSIDGGYGQVPDFTDFDRVILVAGGSGSTFTFSIALDMIKEATASDVHKTIDFIWAVKRSESLQWFEQEINQLQESEHVNLFIYVTSDRKSDKTSDSLSLASTGAIDDAEKGKEGVTDQAFGLPSIHVTRIVVLE